MERAATPGAARLSSFAGKTIAVTGAASGIGRALSLILVERGARMVLADVDTPRLKAVADEVSAMTAAAVSVVADAADPADVNRVFEVAYERFGHLDGLASNAGIIGSSPLASTSLESYQRLMRVNAQSAFLFLRRYAQAAIGAGRGGSVVLTSSAAGLKGSSGLAAYSMEQAGTCRAYPVRRRRARRPRHPGQRRLPGPHRHPAARRPGLARRQGIRRRGQADRAHGRPTRSGLPHGLVAE